MKRLITVLFGSVIVLTSCSSGSKGVLEAGGSRIPSDSGIVTDDTLQRIQLDHTRNYLVDEKVESFTTRSHNIMSLLSWQGKFVQVGLTKQRKISWIAGIGDVVQGNPAVVYYSGIITRKDGTHRRVYFDDGTVLTTASGLSVPVKGQQVVCQIDPTTAFVTKITAA